VSAKSQTGLRHSQLDATGRPFSPPTFRTPGFPTISHQLEGLHESGLLVRSRRGVRVAAGPAWMCWPAALRICRGLRGGGGTAGDLPAAVLMPSFFPLGLTPPETRSRSRLDSRSVGREVWPAMGCPMPRRPQT